MYWRLKDLLEHCRSTSVWIDGRWYPARPMRGPLLWRAQAAWLVLTGKADAVVWPEDDATQRATQQQKAGGA